MNTAVINIKTDPAKLNLPKGKKIVIYLGGLHPYKGIGYLLKAIPYISNKFHFLIMGYPVKRALEFAKRLNITNRITFTGMIPYEKAPSYLKLGNLAVSPKILENGESNAKIYNYLAMGLKVVCFGNEENRKILGKDGVYAKEKDPVDLANKINGWRE